jgi:hypothetical protein
MKNEFMIHRLLLSLLGVLVLGSTGCKEVQRQAVPAAPAPAVVMEPAKPSTNDLVTPDPLVLPAGVTNPPAPFSGDGWETMFDGQSWKGWKETAFALRGNVRIEKGVLFLGMGDPFTGVNWTNLFPNVNYEVAFDAMRVQGTDFFCGFTFPVKQSHCSLILGGWGGSLAGISCINGADASENETTKYMDFKNGRWYRVRVRVTEQRIEAWVDQDQIINLPTEGRQFRVRIGEIEQSMPLGWASWQTAGAFREIRTRRVVQPESPAPRGL